ncbi:MAG: hypothetical protein ACMXX9_01945 [Candidatus Woesearchaeota archaeon]
MVKKAQMEMIGLVLIIAVLAVVFLFIAVFTVRDAEERVDAVEEFLDENIPSNFGPVLMESSTDCKNANQNHLKINELINICVRQPNFMCNDDDSVCEYLNKTIEKVANDTLGKFNYRYNIVIEIIGGPNITNIERNCDSQQLFTTRTQPIPLSLSQARMLLRLCI